MSSKTIIDEAIATVIFRSKYIREKHYLLMRITISLSIALIISLGINVFMIIRGEQYKYFATDVEGRIKQLTSLDKPISSLEEILNWTASAITKSYSFSFANYKQELQSARKNFTNEGWSGFEKALKESGNLEAVINKKSIVTAIPTGAPILISEGIANNTYMWKIRIPIVVSYQTASESINQHLLVTASVTRRPETKHPKGLGITSLIAE